MTEFVHNRKRAVTNTIACLVFLAMALAVMLTRATWWATALMAVFVLWAIGGVIVNGMAIKRGFPASQVPAGEVDSPQSRRDVSTVRGTTQFPKPAHQHEAGPACPSCGSDTVCRVSTKNGELYFGCTNFAGGCRFNDRSY